MEDCATPIDEDCDGQAPACNGPVLWAKRFGGPGNQVVTGVAVDAIGNVFLTGYFFGSIDFDVATLTSAGSGDAFVAKLDGLTGQALWARGFGNAASQSGKSIAVDATGDVTVTGDFTSAIDFGAGPLVTSGGSDVFVVHLDGSTGTHLWSKQLGGVGDHHATGVAVDGTGATVLSGYFSGKIDLGAGLVSSAGMADGYLVKLDGAGGTMWSHRFGSPGVFTDARAVAVRGLTPIVVTGGFSGTVDFGGGGLAASSAMDAYVARFDEAGAHLGSTHLAAPGAMVTGEGVALDASGRALVSGAFSGALALPGASLDSTGLQDAFLVDLDTPGWGRASGTANATALSSGRSVATDPAANVFMAGDFKVAVNLGGGDLPSAGGQDVFLAKLDGAGTHIWSKRFGDSAEQDTAGIAVDASGNVVLAGWFAGSMTFDGSLLVSADAADIFIAKFSP
jgi:hypothetical protein